jgi:hypothetical protein
MGLLISLILLGGVFKALMDFSSEDRFNHERLNKTTGSKYKYKDYDNKTPRFPLSTTALVGFTDGWHFFQLCFYTCWQTVISILFVDYYDISKWWIIVVVLSIKTIQGLSFELVYRMLKDN